MKRLTKRSSDLVIAELKRFAWDAPSRSMQDVLQSSLSIDAISAGKLLSDPNIATKLFSEIEAFIERTLWLDCEIPTFHFNPNGPIGPSASGMGFFLRQSTVPIDETIARRLAHHAAIRQWLRHLQPPHLLEATAAALLHSAVGHGIATRKGTDQGVDVISRRRDAIVDQLPPWFSQKFEPTNGFVLASCKATSNSGARPERLDPAALRELVSAYLIQRTSGGQWGNLGIFPLTPLRLVLVTTYRLSDDSWSLASALGLDVWSIPELTVMIARFAPEAFDNADMFDTKQMRDWIAQFDVDVRRLSPTAR